MKSKTINVKNPVDFILRGINKAVAPIAKTMGAKGMYSFIEKPGGMAVTKDGAIVASQIRLPDPQENMGAILTVEATNKTAKDAGDGTTSTAVILRELVSKGKLSIDYGASAVDICNYLDGCLDTLVPAIKEMAKPISVDDMESLSNIATISSNGDSDLGGVVSSVISRVGVDGEVGIAKSMNGKTYGDVISGSKFNSGYGNFIEFITNHKTRSAEYENPLVVVSDHQFVYAQDVRNMIEYAISQKRPLVVFGDAFEGEAFGIFVANHKQTVPIVLIKTPGYGADRIDNMYDIQAVVGGSVFNSRGGDVVSMIGEVDYGTCDKITVYENKTVIVGGDGNVESYVSELSGSIESMDSDVEAQKMKERISRINGNVGVIYCGSSTDSEYYEKKDRLEDAILACKSAIEEGILPGGGRAYYNLLKYVDRKDEHSSILISALSAPIYQICENAGLSKDLVDNLIMGTKHNMGVDVSEVDYPVVNLIECGIIDPAKVVRSAVQNSINVARMALKASSTIVFNENENNE